MGKVLLVYATRTDETKGIAEIIAEGIRISGHEAELKKSSEIKTEEDIQGYDGYLLGSATYHGEMISSMKQILFLGERAELEGKPGGAFGAYGWSGEAPGRIYETMQHIYKMDMVPGGALMLKAKDIQGGLKAAQEYGKQIAQML